MTQAAQAAQPAQAAPPADDRGRAAGAAAAAATTDPSRPGSSTPYADVPAMLNRWQLLAVSACVLFAVLTALLQVLAWNANRLAADNTEQLVRVQNIQSTLLNADALATSAFLIGGLEPADQRAAYDAAIADVTRQVAEAAEAQPADRDALAALNQAVTSYASTITQARDNNRQGFPVGSAYLGGASSSLREQALPVVSALVAANSARAQDEIGGQRPYLVVLPGLAALLALWFVNARLARRFRRRVNVGVGAAFAVVLALTLLGGAISIGQRDQNSDLADGALRRAVDTATARSAANDARANESLRLINRGSGAAFEDAYAAADRTVRDTASTSTALDAWAAYDTVHDEVVALDDAGQWDQAVALSTSPETTAAFAGVEQDTRQTVANGARTVTGSLRAGNGGLLLLAALSLVLGLASAFACTWGIAARRREYS